MVLRSEIKAEHRLEKHMVIECGSGYGRTTEIDREDIRQEEM